MDTRNAFAFKQSKYMPVFPKATGKPTVYIKGYPTEDDEPMAATGFHAEQIANLFDQFVRYFRINPYIHIGIDNFIYYREGDFTKCVSPDIYVVFGVAKYPQRRSFYTWAEGAVPAVVFEFLSAATSARDRVEKVRLYLLEMGVAEYFIHQPELAKPAEFRGWQRGAAGDIVEMVADHRGGLFSERLNLWFRWAVQRDSHVRLLRPYLPDGTPIPTSLEEQHLRMEEQHLRMEEQHLRMEEQHLRMEEQQLRVKAETLAAEEAAQRQAAEKRGQAAELHAREETARRQAVEAELERLRAQLAANQDENA